MWNNNPLRDLVGAYVAAEVISIGEFFSFCNYSNGNWEEELYMERRAVHNYNDIVIGTRVNGRVKVNPANENQFQLVDVKIIEAKRGI